MCEFVCICVLVCVLCLCVCACVWLQSYYKVLQGFKTNIT